MDAIKLLKKICFAGLGYLDEIQEKSDKNFDEYAVRGEKLDTSYAKFAKDTFGKLEDITKDSEKLLDDLTLKFRDKLDIPSRAEIKTLKKEINELKKRSPARSKTAVPDSINQPPNYGS